MGRISVYSVLLLFDVRTDQRPGGDVLAQVGLTHRPKITKGGQCLFEMEEEVAQVTDQHVWVVVEEEDSFLCWNGCSPNMPGVSLGHNPHNCQCHSQDSPLHSSIAP